MTRMIFNDSNLNEQFEKNGYVIIEHQQEQFSEKLQKLYTKYSAEFTNKGFNTTHFSFNKEYKNDVLQLGKEFFELYFSRLFVDYEVFFSNFMVKTPGNNNVLPVHADWTYTDESSYPTLSIWMPANDTTFENGVLGIIPGSHKLYEEIRGPEIVSSYRKFDSLLKDQKGKLLPISRQQAIIYDLRLLHYSLPNLTDNTRVAINITLKHKRAPILHYSGHGDKIYKYDNLNEAFFLDYNAHNVPEGIVPINIIPAISQIEDSTIIDFYGLSIEKKHNSIWDKFVNAFRKK